ncbi:hypothetical protein SDC9_139238 [bioreactor metagenome]|uniref:Uncharacterized protein n=1 Tax=bioreactor metagenome TaxID=1076179 RepID=A0A645DRK1_9ZZZZ
MIATGINLVMIYVDQIFPGQGITDGVPLHCHHFCVGEHRGGRVCSSQNRGAILGGAALHAVHQHFLKAVVVRKALVGQQRRHAQPCVGGQRGQQIGKLSRGACPCGKAAVQLAAAFKAERV